MHGNILRDTEEVWRAKLGEDGTGRGRPQPPAPGCYRILWVPEWREEVEPPTSWLEAAGRWFWGLLGWTPPAVPEIAGGWMVDEAGSLELAEAKAQTVLPLIRLPGGDKAVILSGVLVVVNSGGQRVAGPYPLSAERLPAADRDGPTQRLGCGEAIRLIGTGRAAE